MTLLLVSVSILSILVVWLLVANARLNARIGDLERYAADDYREINTIEKLIDEIRDINEEFADKQKEMFDGLQYLYSKMRSEKRDFDAINRSMSRWYEMTANEFELVERRIDGLLRGYERRREPDSRTRWKGGGFSGKTA